MPEPGVSRTEQIVHKYAHHAPRTEERVRAHEELRRKATEFALMLERLLPDSREKSIAIADFDHAIWAAHAALALYADDRAENVQF